MRWPLQPLQSFQQTQLQPPFGQSVDSLCHPWFTTTNVSYRFPILKLPPPPCAVLLEYGDLPSSSGQIPRCGWEHIYKPWELRNFWCKKKRISIGFDIDIISMDWFNGKFTGKPHDLHGKNLWFPVKIFQPIQWLDHSNNWMVTKLDIHICGPTSVFHFDPHPYYVFWCGSLPLFWGTKHHPMSFAPWELWSSERVEWPSLWGSKVPQRRCRCCPPWPGRGTLPVPQRLVLGGNYSFISLSSIYIYMSSIDNDRKIMYHQILALFFYHDHYHYC